ncbi:hypothetical protein L4F31_18795 [Vibrio paracholerae]|nr:MULTISPECIES: hypothetical protein [Vibrio]MCO7025223.1 hypothetical protein [Vibrio paracholerae]
MVTVLCGNLVVALAAP